MKLIGNRNGTEIYDLENGYVVEKEACSWIPRGYMLTFCTGHAGRYSKYLPDIYDCIRSRCSKDSESQWAFRIQTTAYGCQYPDEIEKVISGYQTALEAIRMVKEAFGGDRLD